MLLTSTHELRRAHEEPQTNANNAYVCATPLNPVRAGMVAQAEAWPWSSAAAHCGTADPDACLDMSMWRKAG